MSLDIQWNKLSLEEWDERFIRIPRSNFLQHYPYAQVVRDRQKMMSRWGLITWHGEDAGLCQIHEVSFLWGLFHAVTMDRGPLWFSDKPKLEMQKAFWMEFARQFPRRKLGKRRVMPEIEDSPQSRQIMQDCGFRRLKKHKGYQTIWLDLTRDPDDIRAGMHKKWRNVLNKSEKQGLEGDTHIDGSHFAWLMECYQKDRWAKGYAGPSVSTMSAIHKCFQPRGETMLLRVMKDGEAIAGAYVVLHGRSATYQIGWCGQKGRDSGAMNFLLWRCICALKERGFRDLDLGGINPDHAEGVTKFKSGLSGEAIELVGLYE